MDFVSCHTLHEWLILCIVAARLGSASCQNEQHIHPLARRNYSHQ